MPSQAREMLRAAEEAESRGAPEATQMVSLGPHRERWDCESVLSLRSNLDNHPARISEPGHGRKPRSGSTASAAQHPTRITLSAKTGLPVGSAERTASGGRSGEDELVSASTQAGPAAQPRRGETPEEKKARKAATKESNVRPCRLLQFAPVQSGSPLNLGRRARFHCRAARSSCRSACCTMQRRARVAKKELKLAFKGEMARQQRAMAAPAAAIIPLP